MAASNISLKLNVKFQVVFYFVHWSLLRWLLISISLILCPYIVALLPWLLVGTKNCNLSPVRAFYYK